MSIKIPIEHDPAVWPNLEPYEREEVRHDRWLKRSVSWNGIAGSWEAVRVLGHGGYGLCGLFRQKDNNYITPRHIVVKQSGRPDGSLRNESRLLRMFADAGSQHIVKMYKSYHKEGGTGTSDKFDPHPFTFVPGMGDLYNERLEISRIYLEFCEQGDLYKWIKLLRTREAVLTEANVWRIFECLARGALVLEQGHEDAYDPRLPHRPVAHFDLKPTNILVSARNDEHDLFSVFKFADFGLSRLVPKMQSQSWFDYTDWRYTRGYGTPEQIYSYHDNRYIGTPCNVWGVGALMYALVMPEPTVPHELFFLHFGAGSARAPIRTMGHPLLEGSKCLYSRMFKQTVLTCLAFDPAERPGPRELVAICQQAHAAMALDRLGRRMPPAPFVADLNHRLVLQRAKKALREGHHYIGETYLPHGPEVDALGFGPGPSPGSKLAGAPIWKPILASPPPKDWDEKNREATSEAPPPVAAAKEKKGGGAKVERSLKKNENLGNPGLKDKPRAQVPDDISMDMDISSS